MKIGRREVWTANTDRRLKDDTHLPRRGKGQNGNTAEQAPSSGSFPASSANSWVRRGKERNRSQPSGKSSLHGFRRRRRFTTEAQRAQGATENVLCPRFHPAESRVPGVWTFVPLYRAEERRRPAGWPCGVSPRAVGIRSRNQAITRRTSFAQGASPARGEDAPRPAGGTPALRFRRRRRLWLPRCVSVVNRHP